MISAYFECLENSRSCQLLKNDISSYRIHLSSSSIAAFRVSSAAVSKPQVRPTYPIPPSHITIIPLTTIPIRSIFAEQLNNDRIPYALSATTPRLHLKTRHSATNSNGAVHTRLESWEIFPTLTLSIRPSISTEEGEISGLGRREWRKGQRIYSLPKHSLSTQIPSVLGYLAHPPHKIQHPIPHHSLTSPWKI